MAAERAGREFVPKSSSRLSEHRFGKAPDTHVNELSGEGLKQSRQCLLLEPDRIAEAVIAKVSVS